MRHIPWLLSGLFLFSWLASPAQNAPASPESIKDPQALLDAIAPFYDFENPGLQPWHLKATYEFYSVDGTSAEKGTWERWWLSPKEYRNTWTRGASSLSQWHTSDGRVLQVASGPQLHIPETEMPELLLSPLPRKAGGENPAQLSLHRDTVKADKVKLPCVQSKNKGSLIGSFWCFDPETPVLDFRMDSNGISAAFTQYVRFQSRDLARSVIETVNGRKLLTLTVDSMNSIDPADRALIPPPEATSADANEVQVSNRVMNGKRLRGPMPEYPSSAKANHITGTVILEAAIGADGKIHNLQAISSPNPVLTEAAKEAVSRWEYQPYLLDGKPVEVRTVINIKYQLAN